MTAAQADLERRGLYRAGGISAIVLAVLYVVITGLYVTAGLVPSGTEAWLTYLAGNEAAWWAIVWLSVFTDILYVPIAAVLYVVLASVNRNAMLAGAGFLLLFVILDLAITWPNYAALISLSREYTATTSDAQRAALVTTATYPTAILDSILLGAYIILIAGGVVRAGVGDQDAARRLAAGDVLARPAHEQDGADRQRDDDERTRPTSYHSSTPARRWSCRLRSSWSSRHPKGVRPCGLYTFSTWTASSTTRPPSE
jgi:hypothetical protein